ncbi:MAG TPA: MarR family transcriptional regulator [Pseudolabrys sp.]|jgi:DNA-binding MarR family transcriptional regulator|nr:MarR family transcriptional regulator [Pseudolabrys sp.]
MRVKRLRKPQKVSKDLTIQTEDIDLGWLEGLIGFNLRIAHEASVRAYLQSIPSTGPLAWRFAILALIDLNPGLTQTALARAVMRDSSTLTAVLDDLCNRGLITRTRPDHDRRSYELRITAAGIKSMEKLKSKVEAHERELDRLFTREQRASLVRMLKQIVSGLSVSD